MKRSRHRACSDGNSNTGSVRKWGQGAPTSFSLSPTCLYESLLSLVILSFIGGLVNAPPPPVLVEPLSVDAPPAALGATENAAGLLGALLPAPAAAAGAAFVKGVSALPPPPPPALLAALGVPKRFAFGAAAPSLEEKGFGLAALALGALGAGGAEALAPSGASGLVLENSEGVPLAPLAPPLGWLNRPLEPTPEGCKRPHTCDAVVQRSGKRGGEGRQCGGRRGEEVCVCRVRCDAM